MSQWQQSVGQQTLDMRDNFASVIEQMNRQFLETLVDHEKQFEKQMQECEKRLASHDYKARKAEAYCLVSSGWTQKDAASKVGLSRSTVNRMMNGRYH